MGCRQFPKGCHAPCFPNWVWRHSYWAHAQNVSRVGGQANAAAGVAGGGGNHTGQVSSNLPLEPITPARRAAPSEDGKTAASTPVLAGRAQGKPLWGVLRGDVDHFAIR